MRNGEVWPSLSMASAAISRLHIRQLSPAPSLSTHKRSGVGFVQIWGCAGYLETCDMYIVSHTCTHACAYIHTHIHTYTHTHTHTHTDR